MIPATTSGLKALCIRIVCRTAESLRLICLRWPVMGSVYGRDFLPASELGPLERNGGSIGPAQEDRASIVSLACSSRSSLPAASTKIRWRNRSPCRRVMKWGRIDHPVRCPTLQPTPVAGRPRPAGRTPPLLETSPPVNRLDFRDRTRNLSA